MDRNNADQGFRLHFDDEVKTSPGEHHLNKLLGNGRLRMDHDIFEIRTSVDGTYVGLICQKSGASFTVGYRELRSGCRVCDYCQMGVEYVRDPEGIVGHGETPFAVEELDW